MGVVSNPELVTAFDLDQWSGSMAPKSMLPVLVRRLILATTPVTEITMRGGEGVLLSGWDGLVRSDVDDPHVPRGASAWELGTKRRARSKAESDIAGRTDAPQGVDPATTTYVAVTSRRWSGRDAWRDDWRANGPWLDVRAYDADDLETWLERAPSVHYWISEQLGRDPRDVASPDAWWERWSRRTRLVLPQSFILAGRDATVSQVRDALGQPPRAVTVAAGSREEALAVVCAGLVGDGDDVDDVDDLRARALVVSSASAWDRLVDSQHRLVLVPSFDDADLGSALSKGHHVVVPVGRETRRGAGDIEIPLLDRQAATEVLVADPVGVERDQADRWAAHARRNLLSLRRTLAINLTFEKPSWSQGAEGCRLVPLLLAGSWSEDVEGDIKAIETLTGRTYADVESDLAVWSAMDDTPLLRTGSAWRVVSKEDVWDLVSSLVTPTDLTRFHELAPRVLGETDPALDVPLERRYMAAVVGKPRTWSARLRQGLADTAAFLGGYATDQALRDGATGKLHAHRLVRAVTDPANADQTGRAWQSLADVLPLLAEAAPDTFLDAVDIDLRRDEPMLRSLFLASEVITFGTSSLHFSLVWALESLAWCGDHMSRAANALARLAEIDPEPDGRTHPRPAGSLADLFGLSSPQTSLSLDRRLVVLDVLHRRHPGIAWSVMRAILPTHLGRGFGSPSHHPRWRSWAQGQPGTITYAELYDGITKVLTRAIEDAGKDSERWRDLVGHIDSLPVADRDRLLAAFEGLDAATLGDEGRVEVWRTLVDLAAQHRQFPDAPWAMPADVVDRVESVAAHFAPTSLVDLHADLLGHHPRLPGIDPHDHAAYEEALRAARRGAVSAILDSGGVAELLRFGAAGVLPAAVGWAAAEVRDDDLADDLLPLLGSDGSDGEVARGYAGARIEADGLNWVARQLQRWPGDHAVDQQAGLLLAVPWPTVDFIAVVDALHADVRAAFWERMVPMRSDTAARPFVAQRLIEHGRAWAALNVLVMILPGNATNGPALDVDLVESALLAAATGPSLDAHQAGSLSWEVGELLDHLERSGSDLQTRARLEFLFTNLLQYTRPPRALYEALAADPALFAEILSYVYYAEDEAREQEVPPDRKAVAEVGFAVVRSWHTPPGVRPDGTVDGDALRAWVTEARRLLAESGRPVPGDISIGDILSYVPPDSDGLWPPEAVRDLIEDLRSEHFETGLRTGKINSRGLVTWSPTGGGVQERGLAAQLRGWAERVADGWYRTAALLRQIADHYDEWARREDDRSEDFGDQGP
jgi:hypothetical protein